VARYAVLLRGINVGRNKRVAMADLRDLLTGLGHTDVATLLQSGNAVLTSGSRSADRVASGVEEALREQLGLDVRVLARAADDVRAVLDGDPFGATATDGSRYLALFLSAAPDAALLADHDPVALDPDNVRLGDRVLYQWCPDGVLAAPPVMAHVEKHLGVTVTGRNWNTLGKLAAML
jgi:uncharacterized protein (DUF1697 family)